jgi:pimeloyl-ACP methyl ester carboxylesterase
MTLRIALPVLCAVLLTTGCGSVERRGTDADAIATAARMTKTPIRTQTFTLMSHVRFGRQGDPLTVYIEGDGRAWTTRTQLSLNPTPDNPIALRLAAIDTAGNVAYLARPCQYVDLGKEKRCDDAYWSSKRFAPEVIAATEQAIDKLKSDAGAREIHLVGYSGGAAVAALVAARRTDVASLRTVAGNLDHVALHNHHRVSQIPASLNPIDIAGKLARLPQIHYSGGRDQVVPGFIASRFADRVNGGGCVKVVPVMNASHEDGWVERWPSALRESPACPR